MSEMRGLWQQIRAQSGSGAKAAPPSRPSGPKAAAGQAAGDEPATGGAKAAPKTDASGLRVPDTVSISKDGVDDGLPDLGVEYDFSILVRNVGKFPSGPFFVRFTLSGDEDWTDDFEHEGLKPGDTVKAIVDFGPFQQKGDYDLMACVYSKSAPDKPIHCSGNLGFDVPSPVHLHKG